MKTLNQFTNTQIVKAIKRLSTESLCGVSIVYPHEVYDFINMMQDYEIKEIEYLLNGVKFF